jgi:hypothetical protein
MLVHQGSFQNCRANPGARGSARAQLGSVFAVRSWQEESLELRFREPLAPIACVIEIFSRARIDARLLSCRN